MGFRFFRRIRIAPGITLNLSKRGVSVSGGARGAKVTVGTHGVRRTLGIPGTGLFHTEQTSWKSGSRTRRSSRRSTPTPDPTDRLTMGFFKRLITPQDEEDLVDGLAALYKRREGEALDHFDKAAHLADAAFLGGILHLKQGKPDRAVSLLAFAAERQAQLGRDVARYGVHVQMHLSITPQVMAALNVDRRGVELALAEALQELDRLEEAIDHLKKLRRLRPRDPFVTLSLVELLLEARPNDRRVQKRVLELTEGIDNESEIHGALLLFRAKALGGLGLNTAARTLLSKTLRRKKGRSKELLRALRYERAMVYERLGQSARARSDFELIFAASPDFEDVAGRLGLKETTARISAKKRSRGRKRAVRL